MTRAILVDFLAGFATFARSWAQRSREEVAKWNVRDGRKARVARAHATLTRAMPR